MPSFRLSLASIMPELAGADKTGLMWAGRQAVIEMKRPGVSRWPVRTGRSKLGFGYRVTGRDVILTNRYDYAYYVERGDPASRTRGSARRTLLRGAARKRILDASLRKKLRGNNKPVTEQARLARRRRDEQIILEGEPDSRLSREGKLSEAARRRRNRQRRRTYRLGRILNENATVRPWRRLRGAEINVAARLANSILGLSTPVSPFDIEGIVERRRYARKPSRRLLSVAWTLARYSLFS